MVGIWPKDSDKGDINCTHLSHTGNALATGDDSGLVKLFEFPCTASQVRLSPLPLLLDFRDLVLLLPVEDLVPCPFLRFSSLAMF